MIVGRLIPAGTGAAMNRLRVTATSRDAALRAAQRPAAVDEPVEVPAELTAPQSPLADVQPEA